jgi:hypothetical protein
MRQLDATYSLLALLAGEDSAEALARAGLRPEEIARITGRPVTAEPKPLPFWASRLPARDPVGQP